jgi:hypothetical protein
MQILTLCGQAGGNAPLGRLTEAMGFARAAVALEPELVGRTEAAWAYAIRGLLHLRLGDTAAALADAAVARTQLRGIRPMAVYTLDVYDYLAEVWLTVLCDDALTDLRTAEVQTSAKEICAKLRGYARVYPAGVPTAARWEGVRYASEGNLRKARKAWNTAIAAAARLRMPCEEGRARLAAGISLGPETSEGRQQLEMALQLFSQSQAQWHAEQATAALRPTRFLPVGGEPSRQRDEPR